MSCTVGERERKMMGVSQRGYTCSKRRYYVAPQ